MKPFSYSRAADIKQALSGKAHTQFIAGGTNLLDLMKKHISVPDNVVDVSALLNAKIESRSGTIRIAAMARNSEMAIDQSILSRQPLLAKAILAGASPQIRNMASVAGNMMQRTRCPYFYDTSVPCNKRKPGSGCSAIGGDNRMHAIVGYSDQCAAVHPSDMCIALVALNANVGIIDKTGKKSMMAFGDFHRLPGSTPERDNNLPDGAMIEFIEIADNAFNKNYAYVKLRDRDSYAFALVSVAAALNVQGNNIVDARLASGGVAHKPWRWTDAEKYLKGKTANAATFREAANIVVKGLKPLENNKFKITMLSGAIETALNNCLIA